MNKLKLLFGVNCHQPIGAPEQDLELAYHQIYWPLLKSLEAHPKIKLNVHFSGVLYDWFLAKHQEIIDLLQRLVKKGQIELLGGGCYEPILSIIPDQDKLGQLETTNQFIKEHFGRSPQGMWLTEQVWETSLPKITNQAGLEFAVLDDYYFKQAGLSGAGINGYYLTESEGNILKVFPLNKELGDLVFKQAPADLIEQLKTLFSQSDLAVTVFLNNGEQITNAVGQSYFDQLLKEIEANLDWLELTVFTNYLEEFQPQGRIYLPPSGNFQAFFTKYQEANNLHKKMLQVSARLHTLRKGKVLIGEEEKDKRLKQAITHLYQGQCHNAYWPGMDQGLFNPDLRRAIYRQLIQAEVEIEKFCHGSKPFVELTICDFDKDGQDEVIIANNLLNLYFAPAQGGGLWEIDYKPKARNLTNSFNRLSLTDHFLPPDTELKSFCRNERGKLAAPYQFRPSRKYNEAGLSLSKEGVVDGVPVKVEKNIALFAKQSIVNIEYKVTNQSPAITEFWFGIEFIFSVTDQSLGATGEVAQANQVKLFDEHSHFNVLLEFDKMALLWHFPVEPENCQCSVILPSWKFKLGAEQAWQVKIILKIEE